MHVSLAGAPATQVLDLEPVCDRTVALDPQNAMRQPPIGQPAISVSVSLAGPEVAAEERVNVGEAQGPDGNQLILGGRLHSDRSCANRYATSSRFATASP